MRAAELAVYFAEAAVGSYPNQGDPVEGVKVPWRHPGRNSASGRVSGVLRAEESASKRRLVYLMRALGKVLSVGAASAALLAGAATAATAAPVAEVTHVTAVAATALPDGCGASQASSRGSVACHGEQVDGKVWHGELDYFDRDTGALLGTKKGNSVTGGGESTVYFSNDMIGTRFGPDTWRVVFDGEVDVPMAGPVGLAASAAIAASAFGGFALLRRRQHRMQ